jgi:hypothetical protein
VFCIGFAVGREDKDIIKVSDVEDVKVPLKGDIYIVLKAYRSVRKTEGYHRIFEIAVLSTEGYLLLITLLNIDLIVDVLDVDFAKVFSASKIVKNLRNERERVIILY